MATGGLIGREFPARTRNGLRYYFHPKHHGRGGPDDAEWLPELTPDQEFAVFDDADFHRILNERSWLYGVQRGEDGELSDLGTWGQQLAEFPHARENEAWHGYPLWPLEEGPPNRRGEKHRPSKMVFLRMEAVNLITVRERKRLYKGRHT